MELGVKVIHCSERDTQVAIPGKRRHEFVNTWSVDGFVGEGSQAVRAWLGPARKHFPRDGKQHRFGSKAAIYLSARRIGARALVDADGRQLPRVLITHGEAISISDYYTVRSGKKVVYRPTCHYAYHPCDNTVLSLHEYAGKN
jgi:homospermidine synthase